MKIRILGNSLRLRLSQSEVQRLKVDGKVSETIKLGISTSQHLSYILQKAAIPDIAVSYIQNDISIIIPNELAENWTSSDMISLKKSISFSSKEQLNILIEKDFKCLKERESEDESDLFPNPEEGNSYC